MSTVAPTAFDWWSGIWIPIIVGIPSLILTVVALVVAVVANKNARAALEVSRQALRIAERQDMREAQMPRERIAYAAVAAFNAITHRPPPNDFGLQQRFEPVVAALVDGAGTAGVEPASVHPLLRWLMREAGAVTELTTRDPREFATTPSEGQGVLALRMSFGARVDEWVRDGQINESVTVIEEEPEFFKPYSVLDAEREAEMDSESESG